MISLQTFKYKIFEWCIDTLFDNMYSNFIVNPNLSKVDINTIHLQSYLSEIIIKTPIAPRNKIYKFSGCRVTSIVRISEKVVCFGFNFYELNGRDHSPYGSGPDGIDFRNKWVIFDSRKNNTCELYI